MFGRVVAPRVFERENREVFQQLYREQELKGLFESAGLSNVKLHSESKGSDQFCLVTATAEPKE